MKQINQYLKSVYFEVDTVAKINRAMAILLAIESKLLKESNFQTKQFKINDDDFQDFQP